MGRAGRLRLPDLEPGPVLRLKQALHELHLRAGAPSIGEIVLDTGRVHSRSVVHGVFSAPAAPRRDPMATVAEALLRRVRNADVERELDRLHLLWQEAWAADAPGTGPVVDPGPAAGPAAVPAGAADDAGGRGRNGRLSDLFGLCGWSRGELARLVNRQAVAMGHAQPAIDGPRVRRWMEDGEVPRAPIPMVLSALFTERLGRVVTIEDLGFPLFPGRPKREPTPSDLPWAPERTAAVLTEFSGMELMLNRYMVVDPGSAVMLDPPSTSEKVALATHPLPSCALCGTHPFEPLLSPAGAGAGVCLACAGELRRMRRRDR